MEKDKVIIKIIEDSGLSKPLAKTYYALLTRGKLTPAKIAEYTNETRTNTYALLEKLTQMGLVELQPGKTKSYTALPPANLEIYAEKRRREASLHEQNIKNNLSALTDIFYANHSVPGSKTAFGVESVKEMYKDILRTGQDMFLLYVPVDDVVKDFIEKFRPAAARKGLKTYALTLDNARARRHFKGRVDEKFLMDRVVMPNDAYTAPVVFLIYGAKIAIISYENPENVMTTTITSPVLAEAMRQIFGMLRELWKKNYPQYE